MQTMTKPTEKDRRDDGIALVEENNLSPIERALAEARETLALLASMNPEEVVTSDSLFPDLGKYGFTDGRAVGAIMRRLICEGLLEKLPGQFRESKRPGNHLTPRQCYRINA
jgi:hypothetical protein